MIIRTKEEEKALREGGAKLGSILERLEKMVCPGVRTDELDSAASELVRAEGGAPAFLGYMPDGAKRAYPSALCVSVNDAIVHGIPTENPYTLKDGDIVSLDLGFGYRGFITDAAVAAIAGEGSEETLLLIWAAKEALALAIKAARDGNTTGHIGEAVETIADKYGLSVPRELGGHGVGRRVHEEPFVPNFGKGGSGDKLVSGMVLAIEPMFILGSGSIIADSDGYTLRSADKTLSVQIEHTVIVTPKGGDIITRA